MCMREEEVGGTSRTNPPFEQNVDMAKAPVAEGMVRASGCGVRLQFLIRPSAGWGGRKARAIFEIEFGGPKEPTSTRHFSEALATTPPSSSTSQKGLF